MRYSSSYERTYDDGDEAWRCKNRAIDGKSYCTGRLKVHFAWQVQAGRRFKRGMVRCGEHNHRRDSTLKEVFVYFTDYLYSLALSQSKRMKN